MSGAIVAVPARLDPEIDGACSGPEISRAPVRQTVRTVDQNSRPRYPGFKGETGRLGGHLSVRAGESTVEGEVQQDVAVACGRSGLGFHLVGGLEGILAPDQCRREQQERNQTA